MMRFLAFSLCLCGFVYSMAQHWTPASLPGNPINPRTVATNEAGETIYYGGLLPAEGDGSNWWLTNSVFRYSNGQWDTLGVIPGDVLTLVVHKDTLFAGGSFTACGGQPCAGIAYHDGVNWHPYGDLESSVRRLRVIDDTLYAVGSFLSADGMPASGVSRRIGDQWESVGQINASGSVNVVDITKHNNELVIVGPMTVNAIRGIFHLVGGDWLPLGPGILGGLSGAGSLMVYQGDLYVSGQFSPEQGNAGKEIMRWDGTQFHPLGSGLQSVPGNNAGTCTGGRMIVHDGLLWVAHGCNYAGGIPSRGLATWDGDQWCGVPGDLGGESSPRGLAFYRDTLFLAFHYGNGPMSGAAKFIGESYVGECGLWVGVGEKLAPSPHTETELQRLDHDHWRVSGLPNGNYQLRLFDISGRELSQSRVMVAEAVSESFSLAGLPPGTYIALFDGPARIAHKVPVHR